MLPGLRRLALTAHIVASVGWLGAVAAFLALAVVGLASPDASLVRGAYLVMGVLAWYAILPLCLVSLATGIVQSLGTVWGLFRHYWVLLRLGINLLATLILLVHLRPIDTIVGLAAAGPIVGGAHLQLRAQMAVASGLAVLALLVATVLSVYKPRGLTPYGWRTRHTRRAGSRR
jgi:hypothetical protein